MMPYSKIFFMNSALDRCWEKKFNKRIFYGSTLRIPHFLSVLKNK